jgi:RNA polymerase sigma-70 factor (ECF subfamily)
VPIPGGGQDIDAQFEDLYRRYYRAVVSYFVRLGFSRDDARDLAQDTFVRVYRNMSTYRGDAEWTYLETTARRVALNERRRRGTRSRAGVEVPVDGVQPPDSAPPVDVVLSEEEEQTLRVRRLAAAIEKLPEGIRDCLLLRLKGLTYRAIAEVLGISVDAVKSRLHEAKALLRAHLAEEPTGLELLEAAEDERDQEN